MKALAMELKNNIMTLLRNIEPLAMKVVVWSTLQSFVMFEIEEIHTLNATLKLGVKGFLNLIKKALIKK